MSPRIQTTRPHDPQRAPVTTTCFIANLHCPSCVGAIHTSLSALQPQPEDIKVSIIAHSVAIRHTPLLPVEELAGALDVAGFEVHNVFQDNKVVYKSPRSDNPGDCNGAWPTKLECPASRWATTTQNEHHDDMRRKTVHLEQCEQCRAEQGGIHLTAYQDLTSEYETKLPVTPFPRVRLEDDFSILSSTDATSLATSAAIHIAALALSGMTCSSCVNSISHALEQPPAVQTVNINLLTAGGVVVFEGKDNIEEVTRAIEDCGFEVSVEKLENSRLIAQKPMHSFGLSLFASMGCFAITVLIPSYEKSGRRSRVREL